MTLLNLQLSMGHPLAAFLVVVILVLIILYLFKEQPEVLIPSLTGIGGFVSGFAGGWGLGGRRKR
jgi:hypothetical protein